MSGKRDVEWDSSDGVEKMIKIRFKDPQLPPSENVKLKYVNYNGKVYNALRAARDAFNIPENVPIALLYKGRRMNPSSDLSTYNIQENSILTIVPDQIKGG